MTSSETSSNMFHAQDDLYFDRGTDGSVTVVKRLGQGDELFRTTIDAKGWCSVIASMSQQGDQSGDVDRAQVFHQTAEPFASQAAAGDFRQRVRDEKAELDDKLSRLQPFLASNIFAGLAPAEQDRMRRQLSLMQDYSAVLGDRIAAFGATSV